MWTPERITFQEEGRAIIEVLIQEHAQFFFKLIIIFNCYGCIVGVYIHGVDVMFRESHTMCNNYIREKH